MGFDVINVHVGAMETVVAHRIRGEVRDDGKNLLALLSAVVEMAFNRDKQN